MIDHMGQWPSDDPEDDGFLRTLWASYYVLAEDYDQSVCTGQSSRGEAMPATPAERSLMVKNARLLLSRLYQLADGWTQEEIIEARNTVKKWPHYVCEQHVEQHGLIDLAAQPEQDEAERMIAIL